MIAFFPEIYEDELIYSTIARYHARSGHSLLRSTLEEMYSGRNVKPSFEFINLLNSDVLSWIEKQLSMNELITKHTMYVPYSLLLSSEQKHKAYNSMLVLTGNWNNIFVMPKTGERHARFCPVCASQDRGKYGETYWHRIHQVPRLSTCPIHRCYLENSDVVLFGKKSPGLFDAEFEVPKNLSPRSCNDDRLLEVDKYVIELIEAMDMQEKFNDIDFNASQFLSNHLQDKYWSKSHLIRNLEVLFDDYKLFYSTSGVIQMTDVNVGKVLNGYLKDPYYIAQMAVFENIAIDTFLIEMIQQATCKTMHDEYLRISNEFGVSVDVVQAIADVLINLSHNKIPVQFKPGAKEKRYKQLDADLFPAVKEFVDSLLIDDKKPTKLSVTLVERKLSMPQKQLKKLEKCYAYVCERSETIEQFWLRELRWSYKQLVNEGKEINFSNLAKRPLNLTYEDLKRVVPHLTENKIDQQLIKIIKRNY